MAMTFGCWLCRLVAMADVKVDRMALLKDAPTVLCDMFVSCLACQMSFGCSVDLSDLCTLTRAVLPGVAEPGPRARPWKNDRHPDKAPGRLS